jgi:hypothetical protein
MNSPGPKPAIARLQGGNDPRSSKIYDNSSQLQQAMLA